jgi:hypothetical protein
MGAKKPYRGFFLLKFLVKKVGISCSENTIHATKNGIRKPQLETHKRIKISNFNMEFKYQYMANCNPNLFNKKKFICLSF